MESGSRDVIPAQAFRATVQYDGTAYYGFQRQRSGFPSVQDELEQALASLTGHWVRVIGAGRTDSGVHALGQVIGFKIRWPAAHGFMALMRAMNSRLPKDIAVVELAEATEDFHPRFDAKRRTYEYRILCSQTRQPLLRHLAWQIATKLDIEPMNAAAAHLVGSQDFATFGRAPVGDNTVREVYRAEWRAEGEMLVFQICANAFLNRMVRSVVGSLKKVGEGKWTAGQLATALAARDRKQSATAAPAHGLYLLSVEY